MANERRYQHDADGSQRRQEFWSTLYQVKLTPGTTTVTSAFAGYVAIAFVPGSTTVAALNWEWQRSATSTISMSNECIYDFYHGPTSETTQTVGGVNESYTGGWYNNTLGQSGWGLDIDVGTYSSTSTYEVDNALIYDTSGNPVWLQGSIQNPTTGATSIALNYVTANYSITAACSTNSCTTVQPNAGSLTRSFSTTTPETGTATITTNVTSGDTVQWQQSSFTTA